MIDLEKLYEKREIATRDKADLFDFYHSELLMISAASTVLITSSG